MTRNSSQTGRLRTRLIDLNALPDDELGPLLESLEALEALRAKDPLSFFSPYPKQREFLELARRERLLQAGNQTGKSQAGSFEAAVHATGAYPSWWAGKRFNRPTHGWICGASGQSIRDIAQTKLFGTPHDDTSIGMIAPHLIVGKSASHGTADLFDVARVRHVSGGISTITTKSYEQDVSKWMGQTLDWIWIDEEPPEQHYAEALARLRGDGILWITFTPLAGFTNVVGRFLRDDSPDALRDRGVVKMGLKDADHFSAEEKRQRLASYPLHERAARENGDPTLGSGAIFTTMEATLSIPSTLQVPFHWAKIWGVDYGVTHPFAAVLLAWDRDTDIVYVLDTVRLANSKPIEHAAAMKRIAPDVRVAWPHDGNKRESDLDTLTSNYRKEGLMMLGSHAAFSDNSISTERGILEMQVRMADGRFRVKAHLADWFDEYRSYHRDRNGKIVKERDDIMSATRIAIMALRNARPGPIGSSGIPQGPRRRLPAIADNTDFDLFA